MPSEPMTCQRLFDMVRHQRHDLHRAELITDEEYAYLLTEGGGPNGSVHRLEAYDGIRERLTAAEQRASTAETALATAKENAFSIGADAALELVRGLFSDSTREDWTQTAIISAVDALRNGMKGTSE